MKNLINITIITLLIGFINFEPERNMASDEISFRQNTPAVTDSFEVANIYSLGELPVNFGFPDTISVQFMKKIAGPRIIKLRTVIRNDSINGPIKEIVENILTNTASYDTIIKVTTNNNGNVKTDFIVVEALPGDVGFILQDDTVNNKLIKCYDATSNTFNHANTCTVSTIPIGFSGTKGNLVCAFQNNGVADYFLRQIDFSILGSTNNGTKPFKLVVFNDSRSGNPGSLIYSSDTLFPPSGINIPTQVLYDLDSAIEINPNQRFYVGCQQISVNNINICSQSEIPVRPKSFYFNNSDTSNIWHDFRDSAKNNIPDIGINGYRAVLNLNEVVEAMHPVTNDTIKAYLYNILPPYYVIDSSKAPDQNGTAKLLFSKPFNGDPFYLVMKHRNSLETWSGNTVSFTNNNFNYDFTASSSQAYGNNMKLVGSEWCIFSGDVNDDGIIEAADLIIVYNDVINFTSGYVNSDLNNDNFTDITDMVYCYNNSVNFVARIIP
ncbi:MAG: hypothetical protein SGI89_05810 [bacterium]|nr:hypothetical protein [bacterium]